MPVRDRVLRVLDLGRVGAAFSQAVYHGLAQALPADADPCLLFCVPDQPYVCVGMHQDPEVELDLDVCARASLPVLRRAAGGGTVYLDDGQVFFHCVFPRRLVPARVEQLFPRFIAPVVAAYRASGVAAARKPLNDIALAGRKLGGTGAATLGEASVFVGSFLYRFDRDAMARVLRVPDAAFRARLRRALDEHLTTLSEQTWVPAPEALKAELARALAHEFGLAPVASTLDEREHAAIARAEHALLSPEDGWERARQTGPRRVKIAAGVFLCEARAPDVGGWVLWRDGRVADAQLVHAGAPLARPALRGCHADAAALTAALTPLPQAEMLARALAAGAG